MTFNDTNVLFLCPGTKITTLTFGDLFKLMIPVAWMIIAILSVASYLLVPNDPQWASASVVSLSAISGIGLCFAIYSFHRHVSTFSIEENYSSSNNLDMSHEGRQILMIIRRDMRIQSLRTHAVLAVILSMASVGTAVFFGDIAPELHKCTHETCGADVAWAGMGLFVSTLWTGATYLGYRDLRTVLAQHEPSSKADPLKHKPKHDDNTQASSEENLLDSDLDISEGDISAGDVEVSEISEHVV